MHNYVLTEYGTTAQPQSHVYLAIDRHCSATLSSKKNEDTEQNLLKQKGMNLTISIIL